MSTYLIYTKPTRITGVKLADALGADRGTAPKASYDRLIRWGASHMAHFDHEVNTVLNRASFVRNMANRYNMLSLFEQHNIPGLKYAHNITPFQPGKFILRKRFGRWGNDIICMTGEEIDSLPDHQRIDYLDQGYFIVERWLADFEVRVHIVNGASVCMQIKRQKDVKVNEPMPKWYIRNRQHGWHLYHLHDDEAERLGIDKQVLRYRAKHVINTAQLDFGVVDFLIRADDCRVLEVNTAPGLEDHTLNRYVEHLNA